MKKINIYLSGNMTPSAEYYDFWTKDFAINLNEAADKYSCSFSIPKHSAQMIVQHDLARLRKCDIVVANLGVVDIDHHLTGLVVELYEAIRQHKVVYAFTDHGMHRSSQADSPWISSFISQEFESMEKIIEFLQWQDNIPV